MKREKKFSEYLLGKYAVWMTTQKEPKTTAEFAEAVGINRQTMNKLLEKDSDNIPQLRTIHALAKVVGSDIYDYLGITKSDLDFEAVKQSWDNLSDEARAKVIEVVTPFLK
jgi:DNA-binding XRE family transcriptional regulator